MTDLSPLTPDAALLLRRILIAEDSRLPVVHAQTEAMTALVNELRQRGLVTTVMGTLAPLPPVPQPQPQRHATTVAARRLLTEGIENTDARGWLTALGVPITAPSTPRPDDAWMTRIYSIPQRTIRVADVLRTAPDATMRGGATPADEVAHWLDAMVSAKQLTVSDDGAYEFPVPTDSELDAALDDLRDGRFVPPRMRTELLMRGDATVSDDGTVTAKASETAPAQAEPTNLADRLLAALAKGTATTADLATKFGVHAVEASRALSELRDAGRVQRPAGTLEWSLVTVEGTAPKTAVAPPATETETARTVAPASGTPASKTAPTTPQTNGTVAPATGTTAKTPTTPKVSPAVSQPETTVTIGDQILGEVRAVRRDLRQALAPVTAPRTDTDAAQDVVAKSDPMTRRVLVRVVVCLHTYGEMTRTDLRKKMNSKRLAFLPEAIALGLRIGVLDHNARDGKALRLIDHSKVIADAALETSAAEQRQRDDQNTKTRLSRWAS